MGEIEKYLRDHSNGKNNPVYGKTIAEAFGVPSTTIRRMINTARSSGVPICSCQNGYYLTDDRSEIQETINSLRGRIHKMECAILGLEQHMA